MKADSCVSGVAVNEVRSCTDDNHECSDVKLSTFDETRPINVLLNNDVSELLHEFIKILLLDTLLELSFINNRLNIIIIFRLLVSPLVLFVNEVLFELRNVRHHFNPLALIAV